MTRPPNGPAREAARNEGPRLKAPGVRGVDPVVQRTPGTNQPSPLLNFDGSTAADNTPIFGFTVAPPDTEGDVGNGFFFQFVNSTFQIWETDGTHVLGPLSGNDLFTGFGGFCETQFVTDPIVRYDELAGRWLATFLAFDINVQDEFHMCLAVSTSGDPGGSYNRYDFNFGLLADYPKFGVWPDGYYMTMNEFDLPGFNFVGIGTVAFDRDAMLNGLAATAILFDLGDVNPNWFSLLPADLDGGTAPPVGAPNHQVTIGHPSWDGNPDPVLHFFEFHVDFATPANSTLTGPFDVAVPDFNPDLCGFDRNCIPQLGSPDGLDPLPGRPMHGMQYRNFGDHESLAISHTVNISETGDEAAVRWYEVRPAPVPAQGGEPLPFSLFQSGTYAPTEGTNRFMPSIAMDVQGNMALGYSISDSTIHPEIGITGRLAADPLGTMGGEDVMFSGAGSQLDTLNRWGDYSSVTVDPADGCTFWYTNQYYDEDSDFNWRTRIGSFKFPGCTIGPSGTLQGVVTDGTNPLEGVKVTANLAQTTTDATGSYSFTLPVGTYDMTATKYGYLPGSANDVEVTEGNTTIQNFELAVAPTETVNGTVKDSQGGWPLYAKIVISAPGFPGATLYTDPVTGYYQITLVQGIEYAFVITAVSPGYEVGGGVLDLSVATAPNVPFVVHNWTLEANIETCNAPGYTAVTTGLFEGFDAGVLPDGWTVEDLTGAKGWHIQTGGYCGNYPGNLTGGTGPYADVDSDCVGFVDIDTSLITPSVDLSALSSAIVRFNSDYRHYDPSGDIADVDVSTDGGTTWENVWQRTADARGPRVEVADITAIAAGESDVKVRFHYWHVFFAWWWQVDNVLVGQSECVVGTGGLAVGNVRDANSGDGLNGATVEVKGGGSTTTFATPDDPNQDDGFYILYSDAGNQTLVASKTNYASDTKSALIVPSGAVRVDFSLASGHIAAAPSPLSARVDPGGTDSQVLTLTNTGGAAANFEIIEINAPLLPVTTAGFANPVKRQAALNRLPQSGKGPEGAGRSSQGLAAMPFANRPGRTLAAGDVLASYDSGIAYGWGVATSGSNFWLSNLGVAGGDDLDYEYDSNTGAQTGNTIDDSGAIEAWAADGAFNATTGKFWRVNVVNAGSSCIFELDPVTHQVTGNTICPNTGTSERGLAYDPVSNTFWTGSWLDGVIFHFDTDGNILDSSFVALEVSGLAYNPNNGHLLVMRNFGGGNDISVLDALNNYAVVGEYALMENGSPVMTPFGGAGLEFDCLGKLWAIDQNTQTIFDVESGESVGCSVDIPWLTLDPTTGTVAANGGTADINATFDSLNYLPGLKLAQLQIKTDTPFPVDAVPVSMVVRFLDVPDDNQFEAFIYGAAGAGVMMGGPPNCPAGILNFCPDNVVTRADMAGYLWRAIMGSLTPPPVYTNIFGDVTFNQYNSFYIQGIYDLGITAGCQAVPLLYCPDNPNTRAQMSVFIWKGQHGDEAPPACSGVFADVPCPSQYADYIEGLFNEGVTAGCGGGNFCPDANITNGQMSVFLVKGFNIPHL